MKILDGKKVAAAICETLCGKVERLAEKGIMPTLAIIRIGTRADDISYERGAVKRCESVGVKTRVFTLPENTEQPAVLELIEAVNEDSGVHGCLMLRPFPEHIDDNAVRNALSPEKDIDGITDASLAGIFAGTDTGFSPCTPRACMEILDYYGIDVTGKKAVVIGRSLVVGKPAAMMLMQKNATVTVCHTKTMNMPEIARAADILIVAAGKPKVVGLEYVSENQIVIDVGINVDENGKLCGDVDFKAVEPVVGRITPVPGGVGTVTTSVLVKHVVEAAGKAGERLP